MEELLEKLLKEMKEQEKTNKENKKDFEEKKEKVKKIIDNEDETIIVVTPEATCFAGEKYKLGALFGELSESLMKNGISKEQLMMNVEIASLDKDDENYMGKSLEIMTKYERKLEERLEKENE